MENELTTTRSLEVIGAEIRAHAISMEYHMRGTVYEAVEIGRRLVEARDVAKHGEWMTFLDRETPFSHDKANNLIKVFEAYGDKQKSLFGTELSNSDTYRNLSYSQALALLALPSGEREDFVETHDVDGMTTRELQEAIRRQKEMEQERDEAKAALQQTAARLEDTQRTLTESGEQNRELLQKLAKAQADVKAADEEAAENERQLKERIKELETKPKELYRDEEAVKKAADEARKAAEAEWSAKVKAAEDKLAKAEEKAKKAAEKAKSAGESAGRETAAELEAAKADAEKARAEAEELRKQLAMSDAAVTTFRVHFAAWQREYNAMKETMEQVEGEAADTLRTAIKKIIDSWKDGAA